MNFLSCFRKLQKPSEMGHRIRALIDTQDPTISMTFIVGGYGRHGDRTAKNAVFIPQRAWQNACKERDSIREKALAIACAHGRE